MTKILDNLYLGDYLSVKNLTEQLVEEIGITDFINVAYEISYSDRVLAFLKEKQVMHYKFNVSDNENDIINKYSEIVELMNMLITNGCSIYIHCHLGCSRAPCVVIAYLAKYQGYSVTDATEYVSQQRKQIILRQDFLNHLEKNLLS